jgi:hypothetical protein
VSRCGRAAACPFTSSRGEVPLGARPNGRCFGATSIAEIEKLVGELQEAKDFHRCLGGTAIRRRVEQDLKRSK